MTEPWDQEKTRRWDDGVLLVVMLLMLAAATVSLFAA